MYLEELSLEWMKEGIDMEEMRAIETTGRVVDARHIETASPGSCWTTSTFSDYLA